MVNKCCVVGCTMRADRNSDVKFHRIPLVRTKFNKSTHELSKQRQEAWLKAINRIDLRPESYIISRVCSKHFITGKCVGLKDSLHPDWVPSINMGSDSEVRMKSRNAELFLKATLKNRDKNIETLSSELMDIGEDDLNIKTTNFEQVEQENICGSEDLDNEASNNEDYVKTFQKLKNKRLETHKKNLKRSGFKKNKLKDLSKSNKRTKYLTSRLLKAASNKKDKHIETLSSEDLNKKPASFRQVEQERSCESKDLGIEASNREDYEIIFQKMKNERLERQIKKLKESGFKKIELKDLSKCTRKMKYLTAFPNFSTLEFVYQEVKQFLPYTDGKLTKFDAFLIVFMKLSLDLPFTFIGYQYGVQNKTISCIFHKAIIAIHNELSPFVCWPDGENCLRSSPAVYHDLFENKRVVIINCFQIFCKKSGNTVSNYVQHPLLKYLIAILPSGSIVFISNAYEGRHSDKFILENCGFLDMISEDDVILADRSFLMGSQAAKILSQMIIPLFKNRKSSLEPLIIENCNKKTAKSARIYVERTISVLRQKLLMLNNKYPMPSATGKNTDYSCLDYFVKIICAINNSSLLLNK